MAEMLAMITMSAMPIEDKVAMSLVVVARKGITAIQTGDKNIPTKRERGPYAVRIRVRTARH